MRAQLTPALVVVVGGPINGHVLVVLRLLGGCRLDHADPGQSLWNGARDQRLITQQISRRGEETPLRNQLLTDTRSDSRATLFVALGASVAGQSSHSVLARALARRVVAGLAGRTHQVAVAGWKGEGREKKVSLNSI